ncbi:MAG: hypothetical protein U0269_16225 [Polyangiales bacterium]
MRNGLHGVALTVGVIGFLPLGACRPGDSGEAGDAADATLDAVAMDRSAPTSEAGASLDGDADAGAPVRCIRDASESLPPNAPHVDCFGGVACESGTVTVSLFEPVYYCSMEDLVADNGGLIAAVCRRDGYHFRCPSGRCATSRYTAACRPMFAFNRPTVRPELYLTLCEGGERQAGASCASDDDCRPAIDRPDYALRCDRDARACVQTPRPARPASFGQPCNGTLGDCARTEAECGSSRRTAECTLDEDCPAGFDCAMVDATRCSGRCVPRGSRDANVVIPCAVFAAGADGGADASGDGG